MQLQEVSYRRKPSLSGYGPQSFRVVELGTVGYAEALDLQTRLVAEVKSGDIAGALVVLEHHPVITLGAGTEARNLLASETLLRQHGIGLVPTDRGGDATYHGPGQIVGYPILRLRTFGSDVHSFLRLIEDVVIATLADFGLDGDRHGPAGVWSGGRKVCSIGIAVRSGITYHGFALNVDPDLSHFRFINPCGLRSEQMSSLARLLGAPPDKALVRTRLIAHFADLFGIEPAD